MLHMPVVFLFVFIINVSWTSVCSHHNEEEKRRIIVDDLPKERKRTSNSQNQYRLQNVPRRRNCEWNSKKKSDTSKIKKIRVYDYFEISF